MKRSIFIILLMGILVPSQGQQDIKLKVQDHLSVSKSVEINGYTGNKFNASYNNRILAQDVKRLIEPFTVREEHSCWQSEFWGKWFTSAVLAYKYLPTPMLADKLKEAVYGLIETQSADGYIGNYAPENRLNAWDIWGRKYCMLGLISYYDITKEADILKAATKEADLLIQELENKGAKIIEMGNHRGMAASSVLEPICQLYSRTGNKKYLDFAEEIVSQWETTDGPQLISKSSVPVGERFPKPDKNNWYGWQQGQKAYEMMSCYEGLLELFRLTGKEEYKLATQNAWQSILDNEINIAGSGASVEAWFGGKALQSYPIQHFQETCVTVTWIKLSQQLFRLTGEAKYADAIEIAFYNALLGAMRPDGSDWAKYTPLSGQRLPGSEQCGMGLNCCNASGPRGLFTIPHTSVMKSVNGIFINFYNDGIYHLETPKNQTIKLHQTTVYPVTGKVDIKLELSKSENMEIAIRIPAWSVNSKVLINNVPVSNIASGEYLRVNRNWKDGDLISIDFDMNGKLHKIGNSSEYVAITRGPIVLTRDERLGDPSLSAILTPIANANGFIELSKEDVLNKDIWMTFSAKFIPESYAEFGAEPVKVLFCDYASAGNTMNTYPFFRVWLQQLYDPRN